MHRFNTFFSFKKFAVILEEERECLNISSREVQAEVLPFGTITMSETDIDDIIRKMQDPSDGSQFSDALQSYLAIGEQFYHKACHLEEKINHFEASIGRPFFHMKPLDDNHLASWHSYLDFIEQQEDFDWVCNYFVTVIMLFSTSHLCILNLFDCRLWKFMRNAWFHVQITLNFGCVMWSSWKPREDVSYRILH